MARRKEQAKGPVHAKQPIAPHSYDWVVAIIFDNVFKWKNDTENFNCQQYSLETKMAHGRNARAGCPTFK